MARFGFGKREKLKSRKAIEALFTQGRSFSQFPLRVMYLFLPVSSETDSGIQVAVSASKRHFKKAVDRNRIKRLLREAYRLQKECLQQPVRKKKIKAHVFFMFVDKTLPDFKITTDTMSKCLQQLEKAIEKHEAIS